MMPSMQHAIGESDVQCITTFSSNLAVSMVLTVSLLLHYWPHSVSKSIKNCPKLRFITVSFLYTRGLKSPDLTSEMESTCIVQSRINFFVGMNYCAHGALQPRKPLRKPKWTTAAILNCIHTDRNKDNWPKTLFHNPGTIII